MSRSAIFGECVDEYGHFSVICYSASDLRKVYPQLPSKKAKPIAPPPDSSGPPGSIASHAAGGGKKAPLLSNTGGIRRSGVTFSATQRRNETTPTPPQSTVATDVGDSDDSRTSSPECLSQNVDNETTSRWPNYPTEPKPFGNNQQSGFLCTYPNCSKRYKNYQVGLVIIKFCFKIAHDFNSGC